MLLLFAYELLEFYVFRVLHLYESEFS